MTEYKEKKIFVSNYMETNAKTAHANIRNMAELDAFYKAERHLYLHNEVLVSLSGGSDSDILLDFILRVLAARRHDYNCHLHFVYFDTGIEYEATKHHLTYLEQKYSICIERCRAFKPVPLGCREYGLPFLSKYASEMINRLQKHNFDFSNGGRDYKELIAEYPQNKAALRWWCNLNGCRSAYNISRFAGLREFMIINPPDFKISSNCCLGAKKDTAKTYEREHNIDLNILGLRKAEGGVRTVAINSCFSSGNGKRVDVYRPLWWFSNKDKLYYETTYKIKHSDCYAVYGLPRTGCAGCPFTSNFENELRVVKKYEPRLYQAVVAIFGKSYEYTRKYREFAARYKTVGLNQISLFD